MGKLMRKYKGIDEVAVMEVSHHQSGVRTRAMAEEEEKKASASATTVVTTKRRKLNSTSQHFHSNSSYIHQLRSHCRRKIIQNSIEDENICSSDHVLVSWCSSNGSSSELLNDNLRSLTDLEKDKSHEFETCSPYTERTEKMKNSSKCSQSNELESTGKPTEENSRHKKWTVEKMPTDAELEDFFSAAEKDEKKRFEEKYNYDIVKDVPLEGRFEWVELKQ